MHPVEPTEQKRRSPGRTRRWPLSALFSVLSLVSMLGLVVVCWALDIQITGGPYDASTFGTVGEWASGIGTAAAVIGAFAIFRRESAHNAAELALAITELQLQQRQSARHQAERVSAWLSRSNTSESFDLALPDDREAIAEWTATVGARGWKRSRSTPLEWSHQELGTRSVEDWEATDTPYPVSWFAAIMLDNASEQPVYDLEVTIYERSADLKSEVWSYRQDVLPPTMTPLRLRIELEGSRDRFIDEGETREVLARLTVAATFRDGGGRLWIRNEIGILEEADSADPVVRVIGGSPEV